MAAITVTAFHVHMQYRMAKVMALLHKTYIAWRVQGSALASSFGKPLEFLNRFKTSSQSRNDAYLKLLQIHLNSVLEIIFFLIANRPFATAARRFSFWLTCKVFDDITNCNMRAVRGTDLHLRLHFTSIDARRAFRLRFIPHHSTLRLSKTAVTRQQKQPVLCPLHNTVITPTSQERCRGFLAVTRRSPVTMKLQLSSLSWKSLFPQIIRRIARWTEAAVPHASLLRVRHAATIPHHSA